MITANTWYVERADLLRKLTPAELALFRQEGTVLTLNKGQSLTTLDGMDACVFILIQGFAKLMTLSSEGKRFSISVLKVGDFLGSTLSTRTQAHEDAVEFMEAMSPCQVLRVSSPRFARVLQDNPQLYVTVLQNLEGKTRLFHRKLSELLFKDVHARIAQLFLDMIFEHGESCPHAFGLQRDLCLKHHEIAELIGASRPVTSVALGQFARADLIHKHDGLICLQDLDALKRVAEEGAKALNQFPVLLAS